MRRYYCVIQAETDIELPEDILRLIGNHLLELDSIKKFNEVIKSIKEDVNVIYGIELTPEFPIRITRFTTVNDDLRCSYWLLRSPKNILTLPFFVCEPDHTL